MVIAGLRALRSFQNVSESLVGMSFCPRFEMQDVLGLVRGLANELFIVVETCVTELLPRLPKQRFSRSSCDAVDNRAI